MAKKKDWKKFVEDLEELHEEIGGAYPTAPEPEGKQKVKFRKKHMNLREYLKTLPEDDETRLGFEELLDGNKIAEAMMSDYTRVVEEEITDPNEYELVQTCGACPEQYEVMRDGEQVGYLRLRHGCFRADCPDCGGETVYSTYTKGDGVFDEDERDGYLSAALEAIDEWYRERESGQQDT